jgi:methionyl-tRNA synthetase
MPGAGDLDFNSEEFISRVNTTLANNIGNLHHRTAVFCDRSFEGMIPDAPWDDTIAAAVDEAARAIAEHFDRGEFKLVVERIHALGNRGNKYYQDSKPWELIKSTPDDAAVVMVTCVNLIKALAVFLKPIVPALCEPIERKLGITLAWEDYSFSLRNSQMGPTEKLVQPLDKADLEPLFVSASAEEKQEEVPDDRIEFDTFSKIKLKVAKVIAVEPVPKSKKLLKLQVELGDEKRQIIAGIAAYYTPEDLIGKQVVVVANLKPVKLFGQLSQGMVLAAQNEDGTFCVISPEKECSSGASVA